MRHFKSRLPRLAAGLLVVGTLVGVALAAGTQGTQSDPLVTLSYLESVFKSDVVAQAQQKITEREQALAGELAADAQEYAKQLEEKLSQAGAQSAVFTAVSLQNGQTLTLSDGAELLPRTGKVTCVATGDPGLMDLTDGTPRYNGGELTANHLYMAVGEGQGVKASGAATVMVRGKYTVK